MKEKLYDEDFYYEIARFVTKHRLGGSPMTFFPPKKGGFNFYYRIQYSDGKSVIIRFPLPGYHRIAEEKIHAEVAAIRYIAEHTTIPVPFILHYGMTEESPGKIGPFIIMEYIENSGDLIDVMAAPGLERVVLDPDIDEDKLEFVYSQMADILLQLSQCDFSRIGCLGKVDPNWEYGDDDDGGFDVTCRPLSFNIAQLGEVGGIPHFALPPTSKTYSTASEYFSALADMHLQQLSFQRNQAVTSADDCRKKYIARQLFRTLASSQRLASPKTNHGPFKLWCDDLRPANVLVDANHRIVGVIDWEFTYAAPAEFTYAPPWWLLLTMPEEWPEGLDDWVEHYEPRLETFLRALRAKEREFVEQGLLKEGYLDKPLSARMRQSWETGDFWLAYAARKTWAFDGIFWRSIDERFFGKSEAGFMERLKLLPPEQAAGVEALVERKMREKEECTLVDWYEEGPESALLPPDILGPEPERGADTRGKPAATAADALGDAVQGLTLEDEARSP
ncbi:uncharacterized protein THITE_33846 [Thermothielavioides terrestris NRRL 8126]|uniref:Aminoglycoside phosphotransferase domain-containing protein n=2 Tax=Thermothielavioides terrestris TaxID=2587410 RepID=G2R024_THETT|nr:uncharacterized protein THITE_33846 [Thermothielavioides terrestris NRRL 8126]AEO66399.1 hypothetical protein THITE_33846 [Thermothielavioides terrestris NRRL 8126]